MSVEDPGPLLAEALERWRVHRHPALADLVDRLDQQRPKRSAPRAVLDFQQVWLEVARNPTIEDVGWLAETFGSRVPIDNSARMYIDRRYVQKRYAAILDRLAALEKLEADPRVARALVEFVDAGRYPCGYDPAEVPALYGGMLELAATIGDVRAIEPLTRIEQGGGRSTNRTLREWMMEPAGVCRQALERVVVREPDNLQQLAPPARAPEHDPTELYQAILADPFDLELREVYADVLQANGDPRGTFIALQLHGDEASEKKAAKLLRAHKEEWLGPLLARVLVRVEFSDGFLAKAHLGPNPRANGEEWLLAARDERLATVEALWIGKSNRRNYLEFIVSPAMRALEAFSVPAKGMLDAVLDGPNAERAVIVQLDFLPTRKQLDQLAERMPHLEELVFKSSKSTAAAHLRAVEPLRERGVEIEVYGVPRELALSFTQGVATNS